MKHLRKLKKKRSRLAVSDVVGAILLIAVTVSVGFAAWAWARSAAVNTERNYGNAVASNMNYLNELYIIANVNFSSSNYAKFTLWFYNTGNTTDYITTVWVSNSTWSPSSPFTSLSTSNGPNCNNCLKVPVGTVVSLTLTLSTNMKNGSTYTFKSLGQYGNTYTYAQAR